MTNKLELYKCEICGNIVEVAIAGEGELVCCGQPMQLLMPGTDDSGAKEKHVPVFSHTENNGLEIRIGAEPHPMIPEHYIMFIESISPDKMCLHRHYLAPGDEPKIILEKYVDKVLAREYCNIHGLWEAQSD